MKTIIVGASHWEFDWEIKRDVADFECPFCGEYTYWEPLWTDDKHVGCKHVVDYYNDMGGIAVIFTEDVQ